MEDIYGRMEDYKTMKNTLPDLPPVPPTTTAQQDATLSSQRRINLIWEITQAIIAIGITAANIYANLRPPVVGSFITLSLESGGQLVLPTSSASTTVLTSAFFLIVGFYFSRTNHAAIGGIGPKVDLNAEYLGR